MSPLAETPSVPRSRRWLRTILILLVIGMTCGIATWAGLELGHHHPTAAKQVAKIKLLPDTPPPPPPPPPPERPKIEPKNEVRQQEDRPKQEPLPQPEALKMEGAAGDGPSPFQAGEVKSDYIGGDIGRGSRFSAYAARVVQMIQEELTRKRMHAGNAQLLLWLQPDGAISRYEIRGGNGEEEKSLRGALASLSRLAEAPPADMPMPIGLEISGR